MNTSSVKEVFKINNSKFIYCFDFNYAQELKVKGLKLITQQKVDNQDCWIFENKSIKPLQFDNKKVMFNNKLFF